MSALVSILRRRKTLNHPSLKVGLCGGLAAHVKTKLATETTQKRSYFLRPRGDPEVEAAATTPSDRVKTADGSLHIMKGSDESQAEVTAKHVTRVGSFNK